MTKPLRFLFAAGDVGGARAILPVARLAHSQGHHIQALAHGVLHTEGDPAWNWIDFDTALKTQTDLVIYATSVTDPLAFQCAWAAKSRGTPVLHVLDNWSLYGARLHGFDSNGSAVSLIPDAYGVMDDLAQEGAIADGVPPDRIHITGHPDLAKLDAEVTRFGTPSGNQPSILFISEPAYQDSGAADASNSRGYDERTVSDAFVTGIASHLKSTGAHLRIAPHPREDRSAVTGRWADLMAAHMPGVTWDIVPVDGVRAALHGASHVVGMTSLLLYEAWLLGRPTLSVQPNLAWPQMAIIGQRQGVSLCTKPDDIPSFLTKWIAQESPIGSGHESRFLHRAAAQKLLQTASSLIDQND